MPYATPTNAVHSPWGFVRAALEDIIEGLVPDVSPLLKYRVAPGDDLLEKLTFADDEAGSRRFHVYTGALANAQGFRINTGSGGALSLRGAIQIAMRYQLTVTSPEERLFDLNDLVTADETQLIAEPHRGSSPPVGWPNAFCPTYWEPTGAVRLQRVSEWVWILRITILADFQFANTASVLPS